MDTLIRIPFWWAIAFVTFGQLVVFAYGVNTICITMYWPRWIYRLVVVAVLFAPMSLEARWLRTFFMVDATDMPPLSMAFLKGLVYCSIGVYIHWLLFERWSLNIIKRPDISPRADPPAPPDEDAAPGIDTTAPVLKSNPRLTRMPDGLEGDVLCLRMEDHYLRVYTGEGDGLVLCRLADAVRELNEYDGLQVHRSWWVARSAVNAVEMQNSQKILVLDNGLRVPVSRGFLPRVKEAGWLD